MTPAPPFALPHDVPTLFLLHFLGGSARTWTEVVERLGPEVDCRGIDLPGFGDAAHLDARAVTAIADHVVAVIRAAAPRRWFVAGHSMGAKIAAVVAQRAEAGDPNLAGLAGLLLFAGSPPAPEPMDEAKRRAMLEWFAGDAARSRREASDFVAANVGGPLGDAVHTRAVEDVLRMNRDAWRAWLEGGSREDWSSVIGRLETPALIVAGGEDEALGAEAQSRLMAPHFRAARLVTLDGAGHLLPIERPAEVAELIRTQIRDGIETGPAIPDHYAALIASDRVGARTRAVLLDRAQQDGVVSPTPSCPLSEGREAELRRTTHAPLLRPDDPDRAPAALTPALFATLRAIVDRIVPQPASAAIDLAARIDAGLARGEGDGWRFAALPPDREACAAGLATLDAASRVAHDVAFATLDGARQDGLLRRIERGDLGVVPRPDGLSAAQMKLWFEDMRAEAVRLYVSHPATLARLGYSGIANGGDGQRQQGFVETGAGRPEAWEPRGIAEPRA